jgi:hypothetical protein
MYNTETVNVRESLKQLLNPFQGELDRNEFRPRIEDAQNVAVAAPGDHIDLRGRLEMLHEQQNPNVLAVLQHPDLSHQGANIDTWFRHDLARERIIEDTLEVMVAV